MKTCLVIPCYNEERRLNLEIFREFIQDNSEISLLFVNDGSSDNTKEILVGFSESVSNIHFLNLDKNSGKAEAVRQGMLKALLLDEAPFEYVGFWDADLATPLDELVEFLEIAKEGGYDLILGARVLRMGGKIYRKPSRHFLGRLFATVASLLLKIPIYDTQCGAKIFKAAVVGPLFKEKFISYWIFDVEILFRMKNSYNDEQKFLDSVYEHPLSYWKNQSDSKVRVGDFLLAPFELLKIFLKYR